MEQPKYSVIANGVTTYYATQEQIVENLDLVSQQIKLGQMNAQEIHLDYKSMSFFEFFSSRIENRIMKHTTRLRQAHLRHDSMFRKRHSYTSGSANVRA